MTSAGPIPRRREDRLASYLTGTLIDVSGGKLATRIPRLADEAAAAAGAHELE